MFGVEGDGCLFRGEVDVGINNTLHLGEALLDIDGAAGAAHPPDGKDYPLAALLARALNGLLICLSGVLLGCPVEIFFR